MNKKKILKMLNIIQLVIFLSIIVLFISVVAFPDTYVNLLANHIVANREIINADAIVVLGGNEWNNRLNEGLKLYEEGYSDKIILSGIGDNTNIISRLQEANISEKSYYIERESQSTAENAEYLIKYVEENGINSLLIVSSPPQSRRALIAFKYYFPNLELGISYSEQHSYDPKLIFENKSIRENFNSEAIKYLYYLVKYRF